MEQALPSACAMEFIHTMSLIHDDLPSMVGSLALLAGILLERQLQTQLFWAAHQQAPCFPTQVLNIRLPPQCLDDAI